MGAREQGHCRRQHRAQQCARHHACCDRNAPRHYTAAGLDLRVQARADLFGKTAHDAAKREHLHPDPACRATQRSPAGAVPHAVARRPEGKHNCRHHAGTAHNPQGRAQQVRPVQAAKALAQRDRSALHIGGIDHVLEVRFDLRCRLRASLLRAKLFGNEQVQLRGNELLQRAQQGAIALA